MLIADAAFRVLRDEDLRKRCDRLLVYHGRDRIPLTYPWAPENYWANRMPVVAVVTYMRFAEIVLALQVGWDYPLLSKPSYEHGSIDAADLAAGPAADFRLATGNFCDARCSENALRR